MGIEIRGIRPRVRTPPQLRAQVDAETGSFHHAGREECARLGPIVAVGEPRAPNRCGRDRGRVPGVAESGAAAVSRDSVIGRPQRRVRRVALCIARQPPVVPDVPGSGQPPARAVEGSPVQPECRVERHIGPLGLDTRTITRPSDDALDGFGLRVLVGGLEAPALGNRRRQQRGFYVVARTVTRGCVTVLCAGLWVETHFPGIVSAQAEAQPLHGLVAGKQRDERRDAGPCLAVAPARERRVGERDLRGFVLGRENGGDMRLLVCEPRPPSRAGNVGLRQSQG